MPFKKGEGGRHPGVPNKATAAIKAVAQLHGEAAVSVLVGIMKNRKAPHASRVAAANALLDRGYGKPAQALTDADGGPLIPAKVVHEHISGTGENH